MLEHLEGEEGWLISDFFFEDGEFACDLVHEKVLVSRATPAPRVLADHAAARAHSTARQDARSCTRPPTSGTRHRTCSAASHSQFPVRCPPRVVATCQSARRFARSAANTLPGRGTRGEAPKVPSGANGFVFFVNYASKKK